MYKWGYCDIDFQCQEQISTFILSKAELFFLKAYDLHTWCVYVLGSVAYKNGVTVTLTLNVKVK